MNKKKVDANILDRKYNQLTTDGGVSFWLGLIFLDKNNLN